MQSIENILEDRRSFPKDSKYLKAVQNLGTGTSVRQSITVSFRGLVQPNNRVLFVPQH